METLFFFVCLLLVNLKQQMMHCNFLTVIVMTYMTFRKLQLKTELLFALITELSWPIFGAGVNMGQAFNSVCTKLLLSKYGIS